MLRLTRDELIERLRAHLIEITDDEHSVCDVAARHGVFCRGFGRLSSTELREKFDWLAKKSHKPLTRSELEEKANTWQLARQMFHDKGIACDAEQIDHGQCTGWDGFTNEALSDFHEQLFEEKVEVLTGGGE